MLRGETIKRIKALRSEAISLGYDWPSTPTGFTDPETATTEELVEFLSSVSAFIISHNSETLSKRITKDWVIEVNELADRYDSGDMKLEEFTYDQLTYLIYWTWGISGINETVSTKLSKRVLEERGVPYNDEYANQLVTITEEWF